MDKRWWMALSGGKEDAAARSRMLLASASAAVLVDAMVGMLVLVQFRYEPMSKLVAQVMLNLVSVTTRRRVQAGEPRAWAR